MSGNGQDKQNREAQGLKTPKHVSINTHTQVYMGVRVLCEALPKTESGQVWMRSYFVWKGNMIC